MLFLKYLQIEMSEESSDSEEWSYSEEEDSTEYSEEEIEPIDEQLKRGERLISKACEEGNIGKAKEILNSSSSYIWTSLCSQALIIAVERKHDELASFLLHAVEQKKEGGVLHYTVKRGNIEIMEMLLKRWSIDELPIHVAAKNGHDEVVELLIRRGAGVNGLNYEKIPPLQLACKGGHLSTVRLLVERGADINRIKKHQLLLQQITNIQRW